MIALSNLGVLMYTIEGLGQSTFVPYGRVQVPGWKREVQKAMRELDAARLTACVHDAEWAIFQRWQELGARGGHTEERAEMAAGVEQLLSIQIHKLKWPDFRTKC
jgi:hypothetical protein